MTQHLTELHRRLMISVVTVLTVFLVAYIFKEQIFLWMVNPLKAGQSQNLNMIFTGVAELFFTYLKLCFLTGLFVGIPVILWQVWGFVTPGLYSAEKKVALPFLLATGCLFYIGGAFTYFVIMPFAVEFFFQFQMEGVTALPSVREYLGFFVKMVFAFGLAFELPVFLLILAKFGLVTSESLRKFRRYAIVLIFVAGSILTPPDPASQLMLAIPLILLYEFSIYGAKFVGKSTDGNSKKPSLDV